MTAPEIDFPTLSYSNLLQELLLALLGHTGDVFVDQSQEINFDLLEPEVPTFRLSEGVTWVTEPDRELLNVLVELGFHYRALDAFVEKECVPCHANLRGSMYRRALAAGVSELLDVYQAAILQIQQHLRTEATPVLPAIRHFLIDFETLLPQVHRLVFRVLRSGLSGSQILSLLYNAARSGLPTLQSCIQRLLWHCNQVLYKQLSGWMVHGLLLDRTTEFFIDELAAQTGEQLMTGIEDDGNWLKGFRVRMAALPPYISLITAEHVNFIGQAVRLLRHPTGEFEGQDLLPYKNTLDCAEALRKLQEQPVFNRVAFDRTIEGIRLTVAQHLWHLVVVKAELLSHLKALKDYFLLSRGEFYHNFLVESKKLMALPPRDATAETDVNVPFQQSALKSTAQHDKFFNNVKIRWSSTPLEIPLARHRKAEIPVFDDCWDNLFLNYKVGWPLGLMITPTMLLRYNGMFMFLIRLKRVQLQLEEAWTHMCSRRGDWQQADHVDSTSRKQLWQLHQHMFHFIANLQIYIQVDVIEANYAKLLREIGETQDFMRVSKYHENYLHDLLLQSFLLTNTVSRYLTSIFSVCRTLCTIVRMDDGSDTCDAANPRRVERLVREFGEAISAVYSLLQSNRLQEQSKTINLRQLFMRLNFNDYIVKKIINKVKPKARTPLTVTPQPGPSEVIESHMEDDFEDSLNDQGPSLARITNPEHSQYRPTEPDSRQQRPTEALVTPRKQTRRKWDLNG